jgi:hypothetical protein
MENCQWPAFCTCTRARIPGRPALKEPGTTAEAVTNNLALALALASSCKGGFFRRTWRLCKKGDWNSSLPIWRPSPCSGTARAGQT